MLSFCQTSVGKTGTLAANTKSVLQLQLQILGFGSVIKEHAEERRALGISASNFKAPQETTKSLSLQTVKA